MLNDYLNRLKELLIKNEIKDYQSFLDYIEEMIKDHLDAGEDENEILNKLEDPETIIATLKRENGTESFKTIKEDIQILDSVQEKDYVFSDIEKLYIDLLDCQTQIYTSDTTQTTIKVSGTDVDKVRVEYHNKTLEIEQEKMTFNFGWPFTKNNNSSKQAIKLIIELPDKNYEKLELSKIAGSTKLNNLSFEKAEIESVSAKAEINDCKFNKLSLESVNGEICGLNIEANKKIEAESISGSVELKNIMSDEISVETVSGNITLSVDDEESNYKIDTYKLFNEKHYNEDKNKSLKLETVSGNFKYEFTK